MIYLIDDKKLRQAKDYNWNDERFSQYADVISTIYTVNELTICSKDVFKEGNIILYHESFLDATDLKDEAIERRQHIEHLAQTKKYSVVFFSGSKNSRDIKGNIANVPVSNLYSNLQIFLEKYRNNDQNLHYILFGENYISEQNLQLKLKEAINLSNSFNPLEIDSSYLHIRPFTDNIKKLFSMAKEVVVFEEVTDDDFSSMVKTKLNLEKYKSIYLPISFGQILSDFNGLRMATHIRCTSTINQLTPIYIYSFVDLSYVLDNEYMSILKTKNVFFIDYTSPSFKSSLDQEIAPFSIDKLPSEIARLKLNVPKDYYDSHSIANEWAIYRWANTLNYSNDRIYKLIKKIDDNLYFKYLKTIYPINDIDNVSEEHLKFNLINPLRILYIDDEFFKGWADIFGHVFKTINNNSYDYLDCNFKNLSREEIVEKTLVKIKSYNPDIVLLDFRLHSKDFNEKLIENITGLQVLRTIKAYNPGIQVIMISATNKIWNYQEMLKNGVDGFIIKESFENNFDPNLTVNTITKLIDEIHYLSNRTFLKNIWLEFEILKQLDKNFQIDIDISWKLLYDSINTEKYLNYAYLQLFLIIEKFIKNTEVFEYSDKGDNFVKVNNQEVLVFEYKESKSNQPIYQSAIKFSNGNYKIGIDSNFSRRLDTNSIVSSLLLFRYGCTTSGEHNWTKIYQVRNGKAAHPETGKVTQDEIMSLIKFLKFILNEKNQNNINVSLGLYIKSYDEKIQELLKLNNKL